MKLSKAEHRALAYMTPFGGRVLADLVKAAGFRRSRIEKLVMSVMDTDAYGNMRLVSLGREARGW
jgi:hypothetical protein